MGRKAQKNDSLPGSLDMLILRTLSRRDIHAYGMVQFIQQSSDYELLVEEGSLYPAVQRLELNGWIEGVWGVTSNNRRARIYKITTAGRKQLAVETRKYAKLTLAIARVRSDHMFQNHGHDRAVLPRNCGLCSLVRQGYRTRQIHATI